MNGRGAYESGMPFRNRKQPDLERILDPGERTGADAGLAAFVRALRATSRAEPSPQTVGRHMAEIRAAAAAPVRQPQAHPRGGAAPVRRLAIALAAIAVSLPILATGLAFAGVSLPGAADSAFERLGIDLPNQDAGAGELGSTGAEPGNGGADPTGPADDLSSEGSGSQVSRERRDGARGREASRYGRCVAREARGGAKHPNRRCAYLKENASGKPKGGDKGSAPGAQDSPGKSGEAPSQADKPAAGKGNSQGKGNAKGKGKNENAKSNGNAKGKGKQEGKSNGKGETKSNGKTKKSAP